MTNLIHDPADGPMRVLGVCSGPGRATWAALELQEKLRATSGTCPFEVVGLFSDRPDSAALAEGRRRSLPTYLLDASNHHHGEPGQLMSPEDNLAFERAQIELLSPAQADCLLVDGYQWTIGSSLLKKYTALRIWPAGPLCLNRFLQTGERVLRARTTLLTAPGGLGPAVIVAPPVAIDYERFNDIKSGVSLYIHQVMEQSGRAGARAVQEIALGRFSLDDDGTLSYQSRNAPDGLTIDHWE